LKSRIESNAASTATVVKIWQEGIRTGDWVDVSVKLVALYGASAPAGSHVQEDIHFLIAISRIRTVAPFVFLEELLNGTPILATVTSFIKRV